MKKYLSILFCTILATFCYAQDYYIVTAENGLNVRAEAKLSSEKMGKLRFGAIVEKVGDTDEVLIVNDNGKQIKGKFVKIAFYEYHPTISDHVKGFVFDGYLKKMKNDDMIATTEIDKAAYADLLKKATTIIYEPQKISNLDAVKSILKGRVEWFTLKEATAYGYESANIVKSLTTNNGQKFSFDIDDVDMFFSEGHSGYYPEHDILFLEGGHGSDACFSIATGESTITIGNPEYIVPSPKNTYRLNGSFGGQDCISYFFQKKENGKFTYLTSIEWEYYGDYYVCVFKEFYWINETEFIYIGMNSSMDREIEVNEYFKGKINR